MWIAVVLQTISLAMVIDVIASTWSVVMGFGVDAAASSSVKSCDAARTAHGCADRATPSVNEK